MFTHQSMHVRGDLNEARTDCQAVQRNYWAAKLLGVPDTIARRMPWIITTIYTRQGGTWGSCRPNTFLRNALSGKPWTSI